jgi:hypothetical protein
MVSEEEAKTERLGEIRTCAYCGDPEVIDIRIELL